MNKGFNLSHGGATFYHIEPCPKCGSEKLAYVEQLRMFYTCCNECDYSPEGQGATLLMSPVSSAKQPKAHAAITKTLFQKWNDAIAKLNNKEPLKVTMRINKKKEK